MTLWFAMIDVSKSLRFSQSKNVEEKLKLVNELKIITSPKHVYNLWSEVISTAAHGELINLDTLQKFNQKENWKQESCLLSRKYFKWLGNLTLHDLERLANHLLNQSGEKHKFPYPKFTIKAISSMLESCYSTKDWVERRKRKQLIKKELNNIDPTLGLINAEEELIHENWKEFKASRCITSASMNVLLERPGEQYFTQAKQLKSKNKTCAQISPAAAKFFRVFLRHKSRFEKPIVQAEYRTYNVQRNTFSNWRAGTWDSDTMNHIGLGVMDLRELSGVEMTMVEPGKRPYFYSVIGSMENTRSPFVGEIDNWLIISGTESHEKQQALDYTNAHEWFRRLHYDMANYIPTSGLEMPPLHGCLRGSCFSSTRTLKRRGPCQSQMSSTLLTHPSSTSLTATTSSSTECIRRNSEWSSTSGS